MTSSRCAYERSTSSIGHHETAEYQGRSERGRDNRSSRMGSARSAKRHSSLPRCCTATSNERICDWVARATLSHGRSPSHFARAGLCSMPIIVGTLRGRRAIWRALHKADNPCSLIDPDLGFRSGQIEPHVCRTQECRGICIIHQPSSLSLLPTRGRTEFAAQVDE